VPVTSVPPTLLDIKNSDRSDTGDPGRTSPTFVATNHRVISRCALIRTRRSELAYIPTGWYALLD